VEGGGGEKSVGEFAKELEEGEGGGGGAAVEGDV
jgi:hypothetical protein